MAWWVDIAAVALVLLPLLGAVLAMPLGVWGKIRVAELAVVLTVSLSGLLAIFVLIGVSVLDHSSTVQLFSWISTESFSFNWAVRVDMLSAVMFFMVSVVSALVHIYSLGYMASDSSRPRFFAYLSFFTFMMLMLVSGDNFLQLFFGWEGVGLASYLLIGFWHERAAPNMAAMKAFIVNRVGDIFFILGMALLFMTTGSLDFDSVFAASEKLAKTEIALPFDFVMDAANLAGFLLLFGAMGKSAQFLLHTWLPDAMEGPTPVSALIHAATMVTAGVFMIARCAPLYEVADEALIGVALIGGITALFTATIALVQTDIKKVIAYSTCSQLGYMFAALGLGAYGAAIFHLFTHAFFKALLFLGAGSVIHAIDDEQDMNRMAGLSRDKMPVTWVTMLIGTLGLTGFPLTAGYFSKDVIIEAAYQSGSFVAEPVFWLLLSAAVLTSFYAWRLFFLVFHSPESARTGQGVISARESSAVMTIPLIMLALGALIAGAAVYHSFVGDAQAEFWHNALPAQGGNDILKELHQAPIEIVFAPLVAALVGFAIAWLFYIQTPNVTNILIRRGAWFYRLLFNKWYFDELYHFFFTRPVFALGRFFWRIGDDRIIDGIGPNGISARILNLSFFTRIFQTGYLYHYAFVMLMGLTAMTSFLVWTNTDWNMVESMLAMMVESVMNFDWPALPDLPNLPDLPALPDLPDLPNFKDLF